MLLMANGWARAGALVLAACCLASYSHAQQRPQPKTAPPAARDAGPGPDAGLQQRVAQLEEQLVDLQVMIGTLESLSKGSNTAPGGPRGGSGFSAALGASDAGRLDAIETQIRALAAQLENLQGQVRELGAGGAPVGGGLGRRSSAEGPITTDSGFGSVTVAPDGEGNDMDRLPGVQATPGTRVASSAPIGAIEPELPPQQHYEKAYGHLLQKDYGGAETAFDEFLRLHPNHQLAGNAQYWLGETHYVRGQYRAAAAAFLKGYQTYARSPKAPEALLKLAMSLSRLGQKDAACSSFNELATKYPNPPAHVRSIAQAERQRSGCGA